MSLSLLDRHYSFDLSGVNDFVPTKPTTHMAAQADGQSMLRTVAEARNAQLS